MQDEILNLACGSGEGEALTSTAPLIENSALPELTIDIPPMQESFSSVQEVESIMPHFMPSCYSNHQYIQGLIMPVPAEDVQTSRPNSRQSSEAKNDAVHQESSSTNEDGKILPTAADHSAVDSLINHSSLESTRKSSDVHSQNTIVVPNDTPKSSQPEKRKKNRTSYTQKQLYALERSFHENPYPDAAKIEILSMELGITEPKLKIWFQNKRARFRKRNQQQPQSRNLIPQLARSQTAPYGVMPPTFHPMLHSSPYQMAQNPFAYQNQLPTLPPAALEKQVGNYHGLSPFRPHMPTLSRNSSPSSTVSSPLSGSSSPESVNTPSPDNTGSMYPFHQAIPQFPAFPYPYGMYQQFAY